MFTHHECLNLPQTGNGKPILFPLKLEFLQCNNLARCGVARAGNDPIRPLLDVIQQLVVVHVSAGSDFGGFKAEEFHWAGVGGGRGAGGWGRWIIIVELSSLWLGLSGGGC